MTPTLSMKVVAEIERILKRGNRAEVLIEQGKVTVVEISRKLKVKD